MKSLNAAEAARRFSEVLDRLRTTENLLIVRRGPASHASGLLQEDVVLDLWVGDEDDVAMPAALRRALRQRRTGRRVGERTGSRSRVNGPRLEGACMCGAVRSVE